MKPGLEAVLSAPVLHLDVVESTNNYATAFVDADTAVPGLTVVARRQTGGRGQRGRHWIDADGESLLLSMIVKPVWTLDNAPTFNAAVAVNLAEVLQALCQDVAVHLKWPNDLIIADKKVGGILIENSLRGQGWTQTVVGVGINVLQSGFSAELPHATSLRLACGRRLDPSGLITPVRTAIWRASQVATGEEIWARYNHLLYRRDNLQTFSRGNERWTAVVRRVSAAGWLEVERPNGACEQYTHGSVNWVWPQNGESA